MAEKGSISISSICERAKNNPFRTLFEIGCTAILIYVIIFDKTRLSQYIFNHLLRSAVILLMCGTLASLLDILLDKYKKKGI